MMITNDEQQQQQQQQGGQGGRRTDIPAASTDPSDDSFPGDAFSGLSYIDGSELSYLDDAELVRQMDNLSGSSIGNNDGFSSNNATAATAAAAAAATNNSTADGAIVAAAMTHVVIKKYDIVLDRQSMTKGTTIWRKRDGPRQKAFNYYKGEKGGKKNTKEREADAVEQAKKYYRLELQQRGVVIDFDVWHKASEEDISGGHVGRVRSNKTGDLTATQYRLATANDIFKNIRSYRIRSSARQDVSESNSDASHPPSSAGEADGMMSAGGKHGRSEGGAILPSQFQEEEEEDTPTPKRPKKHSSSSSGGGQQLSRNSTSPLSQSTARSNTHSLDLNDSGAKENNNENDSIASFSCPISRDIITNEDSTFPTGIFGVVEQTESAASSILTSSVNGADFALMRLHEIRVQIQKPSSLIPLNVDLELEIEQCFLGGDESQYFDTILVKDGHCTFRGKRDSWRNVFTRGAHAKNEWGFLVRRGSSAVLNLVQVRMFGLFTKRYDRICVLEIDENKRERKKRFETSDKMLRGEITYCLSESQCLPVKRGNIANEKQYVTSWRLL